jgi:hypothetical protein
MNLTKWLRERILSVLGVILIAAAADGLLAPQVFDSSVPTLGGTFPLVPSPAAVSQIAFYTNWPFFAPLLVGCVLIAIDVYYFFTKNKVKIG